jgi:small subunit ribosomal protein S21
VTFVAVRDNNIDQALRELKKKMNRGGVFKEIKLHAFYEPESVAKVRRAKEAVKRRVKEHRKWQVREGLLPPKKKPINSARGGLNDRTR